MTRWGRTRTYLLAALGLGLAYLATGWRLGVVCGSSMSPSLQSGQLYLLDQNYYRRNPVRKGDVVVFDRAGTTYIKRVLAAPGDTVYVLRQPNDGEDLLLMDWQMRTFRHALPPAFHYKVIRRSVPPGCCYVVGDHLMASLDSREFGPISLESIRGRVVHSPAPDAAVTHVAGNFREVDRS